MQIKHSYRIYGAILAVLALLALLLIPGRVSALTAQNKAATSIGADVYLTGDMLQPLIQSNINQQVPRALSAAISSMVGQLPKQDQSWALQMANALLQPSATLVSLTPQANGLLVTLKIDLYQDDPKPTTANVLIGLSVANSSTVQVTALPINGKPGLVNGPLLTFPMPIGSLNAISTSVNCGKADLKMNLNFPVSLQAQAQTGSSTASGGSTLLSQPQSAAKFASASQPNSYIELPASSLAQLDGTFGTITIDSSTTAKNIKIGVSGSNLTLTSDVYKQTLFGNIKVGIAVSTLVPGASNGNLVVKVTKTDLHIGIFTIPESSYDQQIQNMVNSRLNGALKGVFSVTQAAVGGNAQLPCAASDSLVMGGTITLGL